MKYQALKDHLKQMAAEIKEIRVFYKTYYREYRKLPDPEGMKKFQEWCSKKERERYLSYDFRHYHIAYCELRSRIREQIENPAQNNLPNETYITQIKEGEKTKNEGTETLCLGQN